MLLSAKTRTKAKIDTKRDTTWLPCTAKLACMARCLFHLPLGLESHHRTQVSPDSGSGSKVKRQENFGIFCHPHPTTMRMSRRPACLQLQSRTIQTWYLSRSRRIASRYCWFCIHPLWVMFRSPLLIALMRRGTNSTS